MSLPLPTHHPEVSPTPWQRELATSIRSARELLQRLELNEHGNLSRSELASQDFPVFVTQSYVSRMRRGEPNDPLLRQVLPVEEELRQIDGFGIDPVDDNSATITSGVLKKYAGRALLITTGACAIHCRYCFRRHYPYGESPKTESQWKEALCEIESDSSISEIILSGGDPLTLNDHRLAWLIEAIGEIPHVTTLRIHTRLPIVLPSRVSPRLIEILEASRLHKVVVIHANHAQEFDVEVSQAIHRLQQASCMLLNQSVLLAGVNDSVEALEELSRALIDRRVVPYYLHQLDRVAGGAHFEVPVSVGRQLMKQLHARLPGYAVPKYVQEVPGEAGKSAISIE